MPNPAEPDNDLRDTGPGDALQPAAVPRDHTLAAPPLPRSSGILLHPTSLPGGRFGPAAYHFVDWLAAAGQRWWHVLPLGPAGPFRSPYMSPSAFAGSAELLAEPEAAVSGAELAAFREREAYWADDWAAYAGPNALADQVRFQREWDALRSHAHARGVGLIGDVAIYVAPDGADHRAHPELFRVGDVAGAPPDDLGPDGQLWGNPLYDWPALHRSGYRWWVERFRRALALADVVRVDHFRGFVSYWVVPPGAQVAAEGHWHRGPGAAVFLAAARELGPLPLIAEDLGVITPAVVDLRRELGLPGMVVLLFGFHGGADNPHRPENHTEDLVVLTGTHDTNTARGWWDGLSEAEQAATGLDPAAPHWSMIELAMASPARLALFPLQDVLGLGAEARMNRPGTADGNWTWRLPSRPAHRRPGRSAAGRHGEGGPHGRGLRRVSREPPRGPGQSLPDWSARSTWPAQHRSRWVPAQPPAANHSGQATVAWPLGRQW